VNEEESPVSSFSAASKSRNSMSAALARSSHKDRFSVSLVVENEQDRIDHLMQNARRKINVRLAKEAVRSDLSSSSLREMEENGTDIGRAIDQCTKKTKDLLRDARTSMSHHNESFKNLKVPEAHRKVCTFLEDGETWALSNRIAIEACWSCEAPNVTIESEFLGGKTIQISSTVCSQAGGDKLSRRSKSSYGDGVASNTPKIQESFETNGISCEVGMWKSIASFKVAVSWYVQIPYRTIIIWTADPND